MAYLVLGSFSVPYTSYVCKFGGNENQLAENIKNIDLVKEALEGHKLEKALVHLDKLSVLIYIYIYI